MFAFYYYEKGNWKLFWPCIVLALLARTDVAFVVMMFGVYGLLTRRKWTAIVPPVAVGVGYFALATYVLVPAFIYPGAFSQPAGTITDPMQCWPCGMNPQLAYYAQLGDSGPAIIAHIVTHPIETALLMFTGSKIVYMLSLLLPLLFLPLLEPRPLVLGLPILALNLLSTREAQYSYDQHYSLLLVPPLMVATVYGLDNLRKWVAKWRAGRGAARDSRAFVGWGVAALVVWGIIMQIPYKNPAVSAFLYPEPPAKVAAANELTRMIPPDAKVAVSSKLSPHLLPRRYIYNFPPAPYSPYNFGPHVRPDYGPGYTDLDYILLNSDASALALDANKIGGKTGLELLKEMPKWHLVAQKEGLQLYKRQ